MQGLLLPQFETENVSDAPRLSEKSGAVYTKPWTVDLILDLAGYCVDKDLSSMFAIEPAAGEGAFLIPMALRLVESMRARKKDLLEGKGAVLAFEVDQSSANAARLALSTALIQAQVPEEHAEELVANWIRLGDYLIDAARLPSANFVIGNPPYIRLEDVPAAFASEYRAAYQTMKGRADIYVAFFEAALCQLASLGVCAFICADRWMLNQYGGELRRLITSGYDVETVIEMHNADAFLSEVSAYPAITIIRRQQQGNVVVANVGRNGDDNGPEIAKQLRKISLGQPGELPRHVSAKLVTTWFKGDEPWPCTSPERLAVLKDLEQRLPLLESEQTQTKVGIGVATGADSVFITEDAHLVEETRLLPLAMQSDTSTGTLSWSNHYLVNPWDEDGLVDFERYPRLKAYLESHRNALAARHVAKKSDAGWMRTIDRVNVQLTRKPKLYIADIKNRINPVLDDGTTYPHHNLYYVQSEIWDLEVLGGLLISDIAQFFIECYAVRMRGGYLRFQAQYLRRIRVPHLSDISNEMANRLRLAFRERDIGAATNLALQIYGIDGLPSEERGGH
jgi:adenine-specific DNA-methyltransferase